jgi:hypothetical protein
MSRLRSGLLLAVAAVALLSVGCPSRQTVGRPDPVKQTVAKFVGAMMEDDEEAMTSMLSPRWLDEEAVDLEEADINAYSPDRYKIDKVEGNRVTVTIFFTSGSKNRLVFRVREEDGEWYIVPGEYDFDGWIHPWVSVEEGVK